MKNVYGIFFILFCSSIALALPTLTHSVPNSLHLSGHIINPDGTSFAGASVNFKISIAAPTGTCVLYQEQINGLDMSASNGNFELQLGSGTRNFPTAATNLKDIFSNLSAFTCADNSTYTPTSLDNRKVQIQFYDGSTWRTFASSLNVSNVPYALQAASAETLSTYAATDFVLKTGIPTCTVGDFLTYDGTNLNCSSVAVAAGTVTSVSSANTDISVATGTSTPILTLNSGTAANQIVKLDGSAKLPAVDGSQLTNLSAASFSGILPASKGGTGQSSLSSGNILVGSATNVPSPVAVSGDATLSATGALSVTALNGKSLSGAPSFAGQVLRYNGASWVPNFVGMLDLRSNVTGSTALATACAPNQTLTYSSTVDNLSCTNIAINDSQVTFTAQQTASFVFAAPSGSNGTPSFRALTAADLPTGISPWNVSGSNIYFSSGSVGIGTSTPAKKLDINGDINLSSGSKLYFAGSSVLGLNSTNSSFAVGSSLDPQGSGSNDTAIGANALISAGTGVANNTAVGTNSQENNSAGSDNTSLGYNSMPAATSASSNTAVGSNAGLHLTNGGSNVFIGNLAGYSTTSGSSNIAIGNNVVLSSASTNGQINIGNTIYGNANKGYLGVGTTVPSYRLDVADNQADPASTYTAAHASASPSFTAANSASIMSGLFETTSSVPSGITQSGGFVGLQASAFATGAGTSNTVNGLVSNFGITTGTGTVTSAYGVYVLPRHMSGTITNSYGLYLANPATGGTVTNEFGVYQASATARNFFAGSVGIGTAAPAYTLQVNGSVAGVGSYVNASDRRLKRNIATIQNALDKVTELRGVTFKWRQDEFPEMKFSNREEVGVIAQEVEKVFPQAVSINPGNGIRSVAYSMLIGPLIEAVKEIRSWMLDTDNEVAALRSENQELKNSLSEMQQALCAKDSSYSFCQNR